MCSVQGATVLSSDKMDRNKNEHIRKHKETVLNTAKIKKKQKQRNTMI